MDDAHKAYSNDGAPVDYPVRLELTHALLNLVYAQLALKQWWSAFEAYKEAMLLYAAELWEGETLLGRAERDETWRGLDGGEWRVPGGGGEGAGGTAPAIDDDEEEHGAGGEGAGQIYAAGTLWRAHGGQQRRQHNVAGLRIAQLIKQKKILYHYIYIVLFLFLLIIYLWYLEEITYH